MSFALFVKRNTKIDGVPLYLFGVRTVMEKNDPAKCMGSGVWSVYMLRQKMSDNIRSIDDCSAR